MSLRIITKEKGIHHFLLVEKCAQYVEFQPSPIFNKQERHYIPRLNSLLKIFRVPMKNWPDQNRVILEISQWILKSITKLKRHVKSVKRLISKSSQDEAEFLGLCMKEVFLKLKTLTSNRLIATFTSLFLNV